MKPQTNREKIQELANLLDETNLTEIELEDGGTRIRIARQVNTNQIITQPPIETQSTPVSLEPSQLKGSLTAPMVGRIYLAPEPGATQFCQVGDNVTQGHNLIYYRSHENNEPNYCNQVWNRETQIYVDMLTC